MGRSGAAGLTGCRAIGDGERAGARGVDARTTSPTERSSGGAGERRSARNLVVLGEVTDEVDSDPRLVRRDCLASARNGDREIGTLGRRSRRASSTYYRELSEPGLTGKREEL